MATRSRGIPRETPRFLYVCTACKQRKRGCDKKIPSCTYCSKRGLVCTYPKVQTRAIEGKQDQTKLLRSTEHDQHTVDDLAAGIKSDILLLHSVSDHAYLLPMSGFPQRIDATYDDVVHKRVVRIMQTTKLSITDVHNRYMTGFHASLPVVSTDQIMSFQRATVSSVAPAADISMLVLCTALIVIDGSEHDRITPISDQESFYLSTKMLYAQVNAVLPASLPLVEAGMLISTYEYLSGRWQAALLSITACSTMFQANESDSQFTSSLHFETVWWCILICERLIVCEARCSWRLLQLDFPSPSTRIFTEPDTGNTTELSSSSVGTPLLRDVVNSISGLPRTTQAVWLLDRVLGFVESHALLHVDSSEAASITQDLQSLLNSALEVDMSQGGCCNCVAITVRTMILFHDHIIRRTHSVAVLKELETSSQAALRTASRLMADVACAHKRGDFLADINTAPISCRYAAHAALAYFKDSSNVYCSSLLDGRDASIEALEDLSSRIAKRWQAVV